MKKTLALVLALLLTLGLCACGNSNLTTQSVQSNNKKDENIIEFDGIILVDNDTVTLELVNFYSDDVNWSGSKAQNEKYITIKATNKTDHEIVLNPGNFYLNNEAAYVMMATGSITPDPGKSAKYSFLIANDTQPEHTALNSIDELYGLEGSFDGLNVYDDSNKNSSLSVTFSIPAALSGKSLENNSVEGIVEENPTVIYSIGDTVSTDIVEFTLTGFNYVHHLNTKTYAEKEDISGGALGPGSDMVFANPEYTVKNISNDS